MENILKIFFLILIHEVYCVHITSFKYSQEDSETKCTSGLISDVDSAVFKSQLDIYPDGKINYIKIYIKHLNKLQFQMVRFLNLQCLSSNFNSSDCKRISQHVVEFTIKIRASKEISLGKIKISVSENDNIAFSEEQQLPEIHDSTNAVGNLIVNGIEIPTNSTHCFIEIEDTDTEVKYTCESKARPCLIAISVYDSKKLLSSKLDNYTLVFQISTSEKDDYRIKFSYGACSLDREVNVQTCFTEKNYQRYVVKEMSTLPVLPFVTLIALILLTILLLPLIFYNVIYILMKKRASSNATSSQRENVPLTQPDNTEHLL